MKKCKIIPFDWRERLLARAAKYADSAELFLEESDRAVPLMLTALEYADSDLKQQIILLVAGFARERAAVPLHRLLSDPDEEEEVRCAASVQLSIILPLIKQHQPLMDRLLNDIRSPDRDLRMCACFALGWKGNIEAAASIVDLLRDEDLLVQLAAVNALVNLREDRLLHLLLERLEDGPLEQKRCILFNLWRFHTRKEEAAAVYARFLEDEEP
ncbi:MAG: HEAT repeat domain-containing protein, partial [Desulfobacterales bacterium]|nr:HEAT repeat domain-containing protein [Desulfobacterales bacterium]